MVPPLLALSPSAQGSVGVRLSGAIAGQQPVAGVPPRLGAASGMVIKKLDAELQIVWGEVYAPGFPDTQGDFMTADQIRDMAYNFAREKRFDKIDLSHDGEDSGCYAVEFFIARESDIDFIAGAWVMGVKVP